VFFLSKLLGQTVRDTQNRTVGTLADLVVVAEGAYPRVTALLIKRRTQRLLAGWTVVASLEESGTLLRVAGSALSDRPLAADEMLLSGAFLDKQLVDRDGHKMIRVNDIQLARTGANLHVVAVDVSSNAIMRRVGLAKVGDRLAKKSKPHLIDWRTVDLSESDAAAVRLSVPRGDLSLLHPADIADIAHELSPEERAAVLEALEDEVAADAVEEMHPSFQAALIGDLPDGKAAELLSNMSPDDAADLLADLPEERRRTLLALMEKDDREDIIELLTYPERSAGGIMTTDFVHVAPDITAAQAIERLREQEPEAETVYYIYVIDKGEHLLGVVSLRDVLVAPPEKRVRDFMTADPVAVRTDAGQEEVTHLIAKYNLLALPVVDDQNVLHGIVTVDDAIDLVLPLAWKKRLPRIFH
jgi:CBS domain-containing protein/sporulation protein YlmC with PRC-barrel domain